MDRGPLAEAYEELKELRRQGWRRDTEVRRKLAKMVDDLGEAAMTASEVGLDFVATLLQKTRQELLLQIAAEEFPQGEASASLIRVLEIKTLADRVFGDEAKAEAWLKRPNHSLSDQRPADLLKDELGTAVVRELLERIDYGIFA